MTSSSGGAQNNPDPVLINVAPPMLRVYWRLKNMGGLPPSCLFVLPWPVKWWCPWSLVLHFLVVSEGRSSRRTQRPLVARLVSQNKLKQSALSSIKTIICGLLAHRYRNGCILIFNKNCSYLSVGGIVYTGSYALLLRWPVSISTKIVALLRLQISRFSVRLLWTQGRGEGTKTVKTAKPQQKTHFLARLAKIPKKPTCQEKQQI